MLFVRILLGLLTIAIPGYWIFFGKDERTEQEKQEQDEMFEQVRGI